MNEFLDTCEHCGNLYEPIEQGKEHNLDCECCYCDPDHLEHDETNAAPIIAHVEEYGYLRFCCQECECNWINESNEG